LIYYFYKDMFYWCCVNNFWRTS